MRLSRQGVPVKPKKDVASLGVTVFGKSSPSTERVKAQELKVEKAEKSIRARKDKRAVFGNLSISYLAPGLVAHDAVLKGASGRVLTRIWEAEHGTLSKDAILKAIGISERTAHRIKTQPDKPLDARTTDGIYRLESVRAMAEDVLGSLEAANEWLNTEAMGLSFRKPIELVVTTPGAEAVKTLLQRMKFGVYT